MLLGDRISWFHNLSFDGVLIKAHLSVSILFRRSVWTKQIADGCQTRVGGMSKQDFFTHRKLTFFQTKQPHVFFLCDTGVEQTLQHKFSSIEW